MAIFLPVWSMVWQALTPPPQGGVLACPGTPGHSKTPPPRGRSNLGQVWMRNTTRPGRRGMPAEEYDAFRAELTEPGKTQDTLAHSAPRLAFEA